MKKLSLSLVLFLFAASTAQAKDYVTKKGDTLAKIARSYYGEPVFGPKGSIEKIYALNAWAKKAGSALEPGQVVVLEDKAGDNEKTKGWAKAPTKLPAKASPPAIVAPVPVEKNDVANEAPSSPINSDEENDPSQVMQASRSSKCPEPTACPACAACPAPPPMPACPAAPVIESPQVPPGAFAIVPRYSLIKHTATDVASGGTYSIQSSQAFGAELAWDHWWNDSFSTILSYSILQFSSNEKSDVSGAAVVDATILNRAEIALLNRLTNRIRFGFGAAYGDHIFLEQFTSVPNDPKIFKTSFWHPFAAAEWSMLDSKSFDFLSGLKIGGLPAQVGQGHDVSSGTEFLAHLDLIEKFSTWSLLYGVNYSTSNQSRTNANETREEWTFKFGAMF